MLTKTAPRQRSQLLERTSTAGRVDTAAGVIRGVRIIGKESRNGRSYTDAALRSAIPLYEGAKCYLDHPRPGTPRSVKDWVGVFENVRVDGDCVRGDLRLIKAHPMSASILEAAQTNSTRFGLSHNASGDTSYQNGRQVVNRICEVKSIDLVDNPATNIGLFENADCTTSQPERIRDMWSVLRDRDLGAVTKVCCLRDLAEQDTRQRIGPKHTTADIVRLTNAPHMCADDKLASIHSLLLEGQKTMTTRARKPVDLSVVRSIIRDRDLRPFTRLSAVRSILEMDGMTDGNVVSTPFECTDLEAKIIDVCRDQSTTVEQKLRQIEAILNDAGAESDPEAVPVDASDLAEQLRTGRTRAQSGRINEGASHLATSLGGRPIAGTQHAADRAAGVERMIALLR